MSKYYERLSIGALTGFVQAPHPDARMVIGEVDGHNEQAGWLMPEIAEVHPKTARWQRHMARYARKGGAS